MKRQFQALRSVSALAVVAVAVGCSSDLPKREFALPNNLCGVSVPSDVLSRLLPASGKKLDAAHEGDIDDDLNDLCNVSVDGSKVLVVDRERVNTGHAAEYAMRLRVPLSKRKSADNGAIAYADNAAASLIKCRGAGIEVEDVSTFVYVLKPARPDEKAMKSLITEYTKAFKKQQPCRPGS